MPPSLTFPYTPSDSVYGQDVSYALSKGQLKTSDKCLHRRNTLTYLLTYFFTSLKRAVCVCGVQVGVWTHRRWHLVVLHSDRHLVVHCQPGRVPHRRANAVAHRVRRGPR